MVQTVAVIYEHGVLRPLKKLRLPERQRLVVKVEIPPKEAESLRETIEILGDPVQLKRIASALEHLRRGKLLTHADVFGHPQPSA